MVVISGEVNDNVLQTATCNFQLSLCIALHGVKHVKMLWEQVYASWGEVVGVVGRVVSGVVGAGCGWGCGCSGCGAPTTPTKDCIPRLIMGCIGLYTTLNDGI